MNCHTNLYVKTQQRVHGDMRKKGACSHYVKYTYSNKVQCIDLLPRQATDRIDSMCKVPNVWQKSQLAHECTLLLYQRQSGVLQSISNKCLVILHAYCMLVRTHNGMHPA